MNQIDPDTIVWTLIHTGDWGDGPEYTYVALNVEHAGCGGDVHQVHQVHQHDAMGGLLGAHSHCATCGEDLTI